MVAMLCLLVSYLELYEIRCLLLFFVLRSVLNVQRKTRFFIIIIFFLLVLCCVRIKDECAECFNITYFIYHKEWGMRVRKSLLDDADDGGCKRNVCARQIRSQIERMKSMRLQIALIWSFHLSISQHQTKLAIQQKKRKENMTESNSHGFYFQTFHYLSFFIWRLWNKIFGFHRTVLIVAIKQEAN